MKIKCSPYNEVCLQDVACFIKSKSQIRYGKYRYNSAHVGCIVIGDITYNLKSCDEVCINNVWLPLAYASPSYFVCEIEIN